jgi:hypothetical protein
MVELHNTWYLSAKTDFELGRWSIHADMFVIDFNFQICELLLDWSSAIYTRLSQSII